MKQVGDVDMMRKKKKRMVGVAVPLPGLLPKNHPMLLRLLESRKLTSHFQLLELHAHLILTGILAAASSSNFFVNSLIRAYAAHLHSTPSSLFLYRQMRRNDDAPPDKHTYPFVLKACGMISGLQEGMKIHGEVLKLGWVGDVYVGNALITMYCRCGEVGLAWKAFAQLAPLRDLVSWNSMLDGFVKTGHSTGMALARRLFDHMPQTDVFSWSTLIHGYAKLGDVNQARELFNKMPVRDLVSWNSMISGYATVGDMTSAWSLFKEMPERNVISWSIMVDGYARHRNSIESLNLFRQMLYQGIKPDKVAAVGAIIACSQLGALDQGQWIHIYLEKNKIITDIVVQTALVDMYMKCGSLAHARAIFNHMPKRNVISWNVMIVGLGTNGNAEEALKLFFQMEQEGYKMDDLTFLGALTACSHGGLVSEGLQVFKSMKSSCGFEPKVEHYGCIVDLLGRAGRLDEAKCLIESMPLKPNASLWGSLLAACRIHRRIDVAEDSVNELMGLGEDDCGVYVLLSNIYAEMGMWSDVVRVRQLINNRGMKKETGRSVIEIDGAVHVFVNGGGSYIKMEEIFLVILHLTNMLRLEV